MNGRIRFYDATLTEGLWRVGKALTAEQRARLAQELDSSHVDFVEIGLAFTSNGHIESYLAVEAFRPEHAQTAYQVWMERPSKETATQLVNTALAAETPVITLRGPLEPKGTRERREHRDVLAKAVSQAKHQGRLVIFKAEDFFATYRRDPAWVWEVFSSLWEAGIDVLTLGDAQGQSLPWEVATATHEVRRRFPQTPLGFWMSNVNACADDNALSAVSQGVSLIHGTLHGYGQNQGYTDLACIGAALWRQKQSPLTSQDLEHLWDWSEILHRWLYAPSTS